MTDKPKLAVWKFASCDGCQLSLLDCEDELLAVADHITIANFPEASRAVLDGPYDLSLVEGSITTPHDRDRIQEVRRQSKFLVTIGACATAGGIQALRNFTDVREFMGTGAYAPLADKYDVPIVVTGFEPLDILQGIYMCVRQLEDGRAAVENQYDRAVRDGGNAEAQALLKKVFRVVPREWRGIGEIAASGWALTPEYEGFDAEQRFGLANAKVAAPEACISGLVLQGLKKPADCPAFGKECTPDRPLGATMVSGEGACAAYFRYRREKAA